MQEDDGGSRKKRESTRASQAAPFSMFDPIVAFDAISGNWINVPEVAKLGIQAAHKKIGMLKQAVQNHVDSFNAFLKHGLDRIAEELEAIELEDPQGKSGPFRISISELLVTKPVRKPHAEGAESEDATVAAAAEPKAGEREFKRRWLPSDCRMAHATYSGTLSAKMDARCELSPRRRGLRTVEEVSTKSTHNTFEVDLGDIPIMVRSLKCNLYGLSPEKLVKAKEDRTESGGYFLLRGLERVIRLLIMPRANYPMAINRPSYQNRGKLYTQHAVVLGNMVPSSYSDEQMLGYMCDRFFLVHTADESQKLITLCMMFQKLMGLVQGHIEADNQDTMSSHEILHPGPGLRSEHVAAWRLHTQSHGCLVQKRVENFLSTGNVTSRSGLDLMQVSGFTVVADKLNQARYSSHFAAVHRGQYFSEMKTTTVRKLLPETWGFLCPVHTPDGSPCGLLNHLAHSCKPVVLPLQEEDVHAVVEVLCTLGAQLWKEGVAPPETRTRHAWVMVDGRPVAFMERTRKLFTGLFIFLAPGRLIRPVRQLRTQKIEWIGPMEQLFLNVSVLRSEKATAEQILDEGADELPEQLPLRFTHEELEPTETGCNFCRALTPFSNHNQSPRNMYQCQMLKQTMATPYHNHEFRPDNKVFRIYCPQSPLVRTQMYDQVHCDEHPIGTNAVVAVITYTGYDMEDAMIINKQSYERGFGHGIVYKTKVLDAADSKAPQDEQRGNHFSNWSEKAQCKIAPDLESDGFPPIVLLSRSPQDMPWSESGLTPDILFNPHGFPSRMTIGMLIESIAGKTAALEAKKTADATTFREYVGSYNSGDNEARECEALPLPSAEEGEPFLKEEPETAGPTAAEYFGQTLKKHGYKRLGTERMYSGIHGTEIETDIFIGVVYYQRLRHLVMDKAQSLQRSLKYLLRAWESLSSMFQGGNLRSPISMVSSSRFLRPLLGRVDPLTRQPVKGRKNKGGIRFGEMERDSLLAHGTSFLLHDRLMRSSDYDVAYVCPICGSVLAPQWNGAGQLEGRYKRHTDPGEAWECKPCSQKQQRSIRCQTMPVPWVFRYLACELASMNVKMDVKLSDRAREVSIWGDPWSGQKLE
eukprot:g8686.t1